MAKSTTAKAGTKTPARPGRRTKESQSPSEVLRRDLDELAVQADLAGMSLRDGLAQRTEAAENAWLAARRRLELAVTDAQRVVADLRSVFDELMNVLPDADRAIRRSHHEGEG